MTPGTKNLTKNQYAWSGLVDYFWIDQPVYVFKLVTVSFLADSLGYSVVWGFPRQMQTDTVRLHVSRSVAHLMVPFK